MNVMMSLRGWKAQLYNIVAKHTAVVEMSLNAVNTLKMCFIRKSPCCRIAIRELHHWSVVQDLYMG